MLQHVCCLLMMLSFCLGQWSPIYKEAVQNEQLDYWQGPLVYFIPVSISTCFPTKWLSNKVKMPNIPSLPPEIVDCSIHLTGEQLPHVDDFRNLILKWIKRVLRLIIKKIVFRDWRWQKACINISKLSLWGNLNRSVLQEDLVIKQLLYNWSAEVV